MITNVKVIAIVVGVIIQIYCQNLAAQGYVTFRGFLYQKIFIDNDLKSILIKDLINPEMRVVGGYKGEIFSNGEFRLELPKSKFIPGSSFEVVITADNYHQEMPDQIFVRNSQEENAKNKFYLKSNTSSPIKVYGIVRDKKDGRPIPTTNVYVKQFGKVSTITDENGRYELRLFLEDDYTLEADVCFKHNFYEHSCLKIQLNNHKPQVYLLDQELKPRKQQSRDSPDENPKIRYQIDKTDEVYPQDYGNPINQTPFVYYMWGTKKELLARGILERKGKFIFKWFRRPKFDTEYKPDPNLFQQSRIYDLNYIRPNLSELFYSQDIYPSRPESSFSITPMGILRITDPSEFWSKYNFVILRVH